MDEMSWRAKLLKSNINITGVDYENEWVFFDFAYRPYPGQPQKWGKTVAPLYMYTGIKDPSTVAWTETADNIREIALKLRKELER